LGLNYRAEDKVMPLPDYVIKATQKTGGLPDYVQAAIQQAPSQEPVPRGTPEEEMVPEWGRKYPTLYGVAGAAYEAGKPVVEALGLAGGAIAGTPAGPAGQVAGAALGYAGAKNLLEVAEEQLGIKLPQSAIDQLKDIPQELAEGAVMEMGGQIAGKAIPAIGRPVKTLLKREATKAMAEPLAREGVEVAQATGMELTPGQITGNKFLLMAENVARRAGVTADQIHKHDVKVAGQAINKINSLVSKVAKKGTSEAVLGEQIRTATRTAVDTIRKTRRNQATIDYGRVRKLAGDDPILELNNLKSEIRKISDDFDVPGGEKIVKQAKTLLSQLSKGEVKAKPSVSELLAGGTIKTITPKSTINKAMKIREVYSQAARGTGQIFKDIDSAQSRMLAGRLIRALEKDFDVAPTTAKGNIAEALNIANKNYKAFSQSLEALENSVLGKMLGKEIYDDILTGQAINTIAPEKIVNRLLKMHPSELKTAKTILQKSSPETWNNVRRYTVERAMAEAMDLPPTAGLNPIPLSSAKFIKSLPKEAQARQLFDAKELAELKQVNNALIRFGDRTGANFSNTAVMQEMLSLITAVVSKTGALKVGSRALGLKTIANAMTTKEGRRAILTITRPGAKGKTLESAVKSLLLSAPKEGAEEQVNSLLGL
jgi:hypothetical protein